MSEAARGSGGRSRADHRADAIDAARRLFVDEGYAAFSMRKVARAVGISQGHLQHYFPTRDELLMAMLEQTVVGYLSTYDDVMKADGRDAHARFDIVISYLLDDLSNREVNNFFLELWPLTTHSAAVSTMLRDIYARNVAVFSRVVGAVRPDLSDAQLRALSLQILALVDGLLIYNQSALPDAEDLRRTKVTARAAIDAVLAITPTEFDHPAD